MTIGNAFSSPSTSITPQVSSLPLIHSSTKTKSLYLKTFSKAVFTSASDLTISTPMLEPWSAALITTGTPKVAIISFSISSASLSKRLLYIKNLGVLIFAEIRKRLVAILSIATALASTPLPV